MVVTSPTATATAAAVIPGMGLPLISVLPEPWATKRPEELSPVQFIELTRLIYGAIDPCFSHNSTVVHDVTAATTSLTAVTARNVVSEGGSTADSTSTSSTAEELQQQQGKVAYQSQSIWRNTRM